MSKKLRIQTLAWGLVFAAASLALMFYHSANKMIVIADVAQDTVASQNGRGTTAKQGEEDTKMLTLLPGAEKTNYLCIPLPVGTKAEHVTIENHYMEQQLWVHILGADKGFYEKQAVSGNLESVNSGSLEYQNDGTWLKLELKDIYEYKSIMENNYLYVEFVNPREIYEKIVVIDPGHGDEDGGCAGDELLEKDIALDIAKRLKEKLDATDIKVYYTRMEDVNPKEEIRIGIANSVKADMFISIHVNQDEENRDIYGTETIYNQNFFIPGFGSIELADLLEREVVTSISGRGNGLMEAEAKNTLIQLASVPAAMIEVGYISNPQEAILLGKEDYRQRIADGIYNAILKGYQAIE